MARRGENIYRRKDGRYEGRYVLGRRPDGRIRYGYVYGYQYQDVKRTLILRKATVYQEEKSERPRKDVTAADWLTYWLYHEVKPYVRESTFQNYEHQISHYFLPAFGTTPLQELKKEYLQTLADSLILKLAPSTVHSVFGTLRSALRSACAAGCLKGNPCYGLRLPRKTFKRPRVLTKPEQKLLEEKAMKTGRPEYLVCLYTGLRLGELCALRWKDIDLNSGILHVRYTVQRISDEGEREKTRIILAAPKTDRSLRDIPIPEFLKELLLRLKENGGYEDEFVFAANGKEPPDKRTVQSRFTGICEELQLKGVHMHTLRHTFATRCLEQNMGIEVLSELLGHSSPKITMECYAHCTEENKRKSMEGMKPICEIGIPDI